MTKSTIKTFKGRCASDLIELLDLLSHEGEPVDFMPVIKQLEERRDLLAIKMLKEGHTVGDISIRLAMRVSRVVELAKTL